MSDDADLAQGVNVYVFGSALRCPAPKDIDLVVVFQAENVSIDVILAYRERLQSEGFALFGLSIDVCLLSETEVQNNSFLNDEAAELVYG